jgi:hypothetical protein
MQTDAEKCVRQFAYGSLAAMVAAVTAISVAPPVLAQFTSPRPKTDQDGHLVSGLSTDLLDPTHFVR